MVYANCYSNFPNNKKFCPKCGYGKRIGKSRIPQNSNKPKIAKVNPTNITTKPSATVVVEKPTKPKPRLDTHSVQTTPTRKNISVSPSIPAILPLPYK